MSPLYVLILLKFCPFKLLTCIKSVLLSRLLILSYIHTLLICPLKLNVLLLSTDPCCSCTLRYSNLFLIRPTSVSVLLLSPYKPCIGSIKYFYFSLILPSYFSILSLLSFKPCIRPFQYFTSSWYVLLLFLSCSFLRINRVSVLYCFLLLLDIVLCPYFIFILSPPLGTSWMTGTSLVRWEWKCSGWLDSLRRDIKLYLHLYMVNYPNFNPLFL